MARGGFGRRLQGLLALVGVATLAFLVSTATGYKPWPAALEFLRTHTGRLADPATAWTARSGDQPDAAAVVGDTVVVAMRGHAEAYGRDSGRQRWKRGTDWVAVTGPDGHELVLLGHLKGRGYDVVDPASGDVRWRDDAYAVWPYRDVVLSLGCSGNGGCVLSAREPADGTVRWKVGVPGLGRSLTGPDPSPLRPGRPDDRYDRQLALYPQPAPPVLALAGGDGVADLVDVAHGRYLRQERPGRGARVTQAGERTLVVAAQRQGDVCRYTVEGRLPDSGRTAWKRDGYDLGTGVGSGCEQRRAPYGYAGVVAARKGDRPVLLAASDGTVRWTGEPGEQVVAVGDGYALTRARDTVRCIALADGAQRWTRKVSGRIGVAATGAAAVLRESDLPGHVTALDPASGRVLLDARSSAEVLGFGPHGLVLSRGRTLGYLPYGSSAG